MPEIDYWFLFSVYDDARMLNTDKNDGFNVFIAKLTQGIFPMKTIEINHEVGMLEIKYNTGSYMVAKTDESHVLYDTLYNLYTQLHTKHKNPVCATT